MSNYNDASFVGEAIEAILSQSFKPKELIIVDDASTDNSIQIIEHYAKKNLNVRLLKNNQNQGVVFSGLRGLYAASGDYLYTATSNDKILPGFFEKSMTMLEKYPQAGLCCAEKLALLPDGTFKNESGYPLASKACYFAPEKLISRMRATKRIYIPNGIGVVWKRLCLMQAGEYKPILESAADWFAAHVVAFRDGICYIPEPLAVNRISSSSYSARVGSQPERVRKIFHLVLSMFLWPEYRDVSEAFQRAGTIAGPLGNDYTTQFFTLLRHPELWKLTVSFYLNRAFRKIKECVRKIYHPMCKTCAFF